MAEHLHKPGQKLIEVWNEGVFMASIYPTETGIKVVSKYIADDPEGAIEVDRSKLPPIPALLIHLIKLPKSG